MIKKYTKNEKLEIVNEANNLKNHSITALKYDIHLSTLYNWISLHNNSKNKSKSLNFKLNGKEKEILDIKFSKTSDKNLSVYMRNKIFSEQFNFKRSEKIVEELCDSRLELKKYGQELNKLANYTNFLIKNGYVDDSFIPDFIRIKNDFLKASEKHKEILERTYIKIKSV